MKSNFFNVVIITLFSISTVIAGTIEEKLALEAQKAEVQQQILAEKAELQASQKLINNPEAQKVRTSVNSNDVEDEIIIGSGFDRTECTPDSDFDWCYEEEYGDGNCTAEVQLQGTWMEGNSKPCTINGQVTWCYVGSVTTQVAYVGDQLTLYRDFGDWSNLSCDVKGCNGEEIAFGEDNDNSYTITLNDPPSEIDAYAFVAWDKDYCGDYYTWTYTGGGYLGPWDGARYSVHCVDNTDCSGDLVCDIDGDYTTWECVEPDDSYGCTDPDALNYDPNATFDDGSCEYDAPGNDTCETALPAGSSGSGSAQGSDVDCAGLLDWSAVWYSIDLPYGGNDVSITICGEDINTIGVVYYDDCTDCSAYTLMEYVFDDVLDCATLTASVAGPGSILWPAMVQNSIYEDIAFTYTIDIIEIEACSNQTLDVGGGTWDSEISWSLSDGSSGVAGNFCLDLADGTYSFTGCDSYGDGWNGATATITNSDNVLLFSWDGPDAALAANECESVNLVIGDVPGFGCTDETACNYDEEATLDDGSCTYPDCNSDCDGGAVVDECGDCGGDGSACADCSTPGWYDDNYCDVSNNTAACNYDGGDCCPGDCPEGGSNNPGSYTCEANGGDCDDCIDPNSADLAEGGLCQDCAEGETECWDGACVVDPADCSEQPPCPEGQIEDCDGSGECAPETYLADGLCDGEDQAFGYDLTCYGCDDGDCGLSNDTGDGCAPLGDPPPPATNLTAVGETDDYAGDGVDEFGITWTWDHVDYSTMTNCDGDEVPSWYSTYNGDGNCDGMFNCEAFSNDGGDCTEAGDGESFEDAELPAGWLNTDVDGDGQAWFIYPHSPHSGAQSIASASWTSATGPLNPDNWLISPAMSLSGDESLSFWVAAQDPAWPNEHYSVMLSTSGTDAADFTIPLFEATLQDDLWHEVVISLSDFAGETVHLAWRHHEVTDMFYMKIDDILVTDGSRDVAFSADFESADDFAKFKMPRKAIAKNVSSELSANAVFDLADGTNQSMFHGASGRYDYVTFELDMVLDDGTAYNFATDYDEITIIGFTEGENGCGTVVAVGNDGGVSDPAEEACANAGAGESCTLGDASGDGNVDILDLVAIVGYILTVDTDPADHPCADYDEDGAITILDLVSIVSYILAGGERDIGATSATMKIDNGSLSMAANGSVDGIQMTLSHGANFAIDLTDNALLADYKTTGNQTILIVLRPEGEDIFTAQGDFEVLEVIAANSSGMIDVIMTVAPTTFSLSSAYPNPFNPTASLELSVPVNGQVTVQVYNLMGQVVSTLASGYMDASTYTLTWDASNVSSGMYIVKAEVAGSVKTQKLVLMK